MPEPRRPVRHVLGLLLLVVAYFTVPVGGQWDAAGLVRAGIALATMVAAIWANVHHIRRLARGEVQSFAGLTFALVAGVLAFALVDYWLASTDTGQFSDLATRIDALYFAVSTAITVGFGDVHATGQAARGVVVIQMIFNAAILATGASLLMRRLGERQRRIADSRRHGQGD